MGCGCENECCIISYGCILKHTPLNSFTDESDLITSLKLAQDDIKNEILGIECYEQLCQEIADNNVSANMEAVIKAIEIPLSWKTFEQWIIWFSTTTYADSATTKPTDRQNSSAFTNISPEEKSKILAQAKSRYDSYKNTAIKDILALNLPCTPKQDCKPCGGVVKAVTTDDDFSHLPDIV